MRTAICLTGDSKQGGCKMRQKYKRNPWGGWEEGEKERERRGRESETQRETERERETQREREGETQR